MALGKIMGLEEKILPLERDEITTRPMTWPDPPVCEAFAAPSRPFEFRVRRLDATRGGKIPMISQTARILNNRC
jgi:hypothetical protein